MESASVITSLISATSCTRTMQAPCWTAAPHAAACTNEQLNETKSDHPEHRSCGLTSTCRKRAMQESAGNEDVKNQQEMTKSRSSRKWKSDQSAGKGTRKALETTNKPRIGNNKQTMNWEQQTNKEEVENEKREQKQEVKNARIRTMWKREE